MINLSSIFSETVSSLKKKTPFQPDIAIILGSGLGDFASSLDLKVSVATSDLPNYPASTVAGHQGKIHFAEYAGKKIILFQGRIHFYEGYDLYQCLLPVHLCSELGCKNILFTNAAGGINRNFSPGDLMLLTSFNSLFLKKELSEVMGISNFDAKNNFLDCPSQKLNDKIRQASLEEKIPLKEGSYWYSKGPSYETPAEIEMMHKFGTDAVGMSTVHEAVYAVARGMKCAGISCITNFAAGISDQKLSHEEVTETANRVKGNFERLIKKFIEMSAV